MAFAAGTRFGVYEITGLIGVGGMGEVYRASDTKLGREVAIKTLPSELAKDRDRLARFEREAKLLASLKHAHIAAIYGLHEHEGTQFLAMELVEGETLERKLKGAPIPVEDALRLALQIAEALEAAHEKGVMHRDLKPANVMVTRDGQVKVLDFGLAKAFSSDPSRTTLAHSPALSFAMTQAGLLLGTAGYMSPEQASGQSTDQRADVWAFGVVLYEMLTGQPLFTGESVPHVLAGVLKTEPDWNRLPKNLHPRLKLLLERCLTKKPRNRLQAIADARVEIEAVLSDPQGITASTAAETAGSPRSLRARLVTAAGVAAAGAAVAALAAWLFWPSPAPPPEPVVRFSVPLPDGQAFTAAAASMIALSADGTRIAYVAEPPALPAKRRRTRDTSCARDGRRGAHRGDACVLAGRAVVDLCSGRVPGWTVHREARARQRRRARADLQRGRSAQFSAWTDVADARHDPVCQCGRGRPHSCERRRDRSAGPAWRGRAVRQPATAARRQGRALYTRSGSPGPPGTQGGLEAAQIVVQSIGGNDRTVVWEGGSAARYLPSGHLVYAQGTALFAIAFDPTTRAVRGGPVPMVQGLRRSISGVERHGELRRSPTPERWC